MISTSMIQQYFDTLQEFESFRMQWIKACTEVNQNSRNAELLNQMEKRAEIMGLLH